MNVKLSLYKVNSPLFSELSKIDHELSPAKYNPNMSVVHKNIPSVSIGPHTSKNMGSMKNYMENFIKNIIPGNESKSSVSVLHQLFHAQIFIIRLTNNNMTQNHP